MSQLGIFVGSVYGNAQHVAEEVASMFAGKGITTQVFTDPNIDDIKKASNLLFISSTTGQGDIPPNLEFFVQDLRGDSSLIAQKPFAVAGLGDSSYGESYCGAGRQIFKLLIELQGKPMSELLEVDACETLEPEVPVVAWAENLIPQLG